MAYSKKHWRGWLLAALVGCAAIPAAIAPVNAQPLINQAWDRSQELVTVAQPTGLTSTQALTGTWETGIANVVPSNGIVETATLGPNGDLYLGGYFTQVAGVNVNGIVRWDGTNWSALPTTEFDWTMWFPSFEALSFVGADLYASDSYANIGGLIGLDLARWDGTQWHAAGSGVSSDGVISHLASYNDELYVLGSYTEFNHVAALNLVRWNGTTVTSMTSMLDSISLVEALVATSDGVYVSGVQHPDGQNIAQLRYWDGTSVQSLPMPVEPSSIKVFNDQLYGVKNQNGQSSALMRWNGTAWVTVVDEVPGVILSYALDSDQTYLAAFDQDEVRHYSYSSNSLQRLADCECSGGYNFYLAHDRLFVSSDVEQPLMYYEHNQWHEVPVYSSPQLSVTAGDNSAYLLNDQLLSWEQNSWKAVPHPVGFETVNRIKATDDQSLYVIGSSEVYNQIVYRYDHGATDVTTLPIIPNVLLSELFVVNAETPVVLSDSNIYRWNGTSWDSLGLPPHSAEYAIELFGYNQQFYALVASSTTNSYSSTIYRWNGSAWVEASATINGVAYDIDVNANGLYLVGRFENSGESYHFIHWNGSQFNFIASSNIAIDQVEATDAGVYVGGWFSQLGNCTCYNLGYWNGSDWQAVGGGTNGRVSDLALSGNRLFVHGSFNQTGTVTALGFAIWNSDSIAAQHMIYLPYTRK